MVVLDAAPIVHLARVGKLPLIKQLFGTADIPPSVHKETVVEAKAARKRGVAAIEQAISEGWIRVIELKSEDMKRVKKIAEAEGIEQQDAEPIYLAKKSATMLVTSDRIVIAAAKSLGVTTSWTTTLLLMVIKRKILTTPEAKSLFRDLVSKGLRLRAEVYDRLVLAIDEIV